MSRSSEIAILDMEWTAWEGSWRRDWQGPGEFREVIQIGIIKLTDTADMEETEDIQILIRPVLNPELSEYFINLTGITQSQVDQQGLPMPEALATMQTFLKPGMPTIYSNGVDGNILDENCQKIGVPFPFAPDKFADIHSNLDDFLNVHPRDLVSSRLPETMGFSPPGHAHDAIADCRCIAEALRIMRRAGSF